MVQARVQLNLVFLPAEDRLLLRIASGVPGSMEEYRLLLTRRLVKFLCNALDRVLEGYNPYGSFMAPEGTKTVMQFQQSPTLSEIDFSSSAVSEKITAPLGLNPLLIHKFKIRKGLEDSQIISLETTAGRTINITFGLRVIHSLRKLLADMVREADWDLSCSPMPGGATFVEETLGSIN